MNFLDPVIQILIRFQDNPRTNLRLLLNRSLDANPPETRAKTTRLVYDIIRKQHILDTVINRLSRIRPDRIDPLNRVLLRIGTHLLLYAGSSPDYAIVNEIVSRARKSSRGYVNAMLRNLSRQRDRVLNDIEDIRDPEIRFSISRTLIDDLGRISFEPEADLKYLNAEPVFHLRSNSRVTTPEQLEHRLSEEGIEFRALKPFQSFEIRNPGRVLEPVIDRGLGFIQNTGSQLVSILASRLARDRVLDGCAAPGTKSMNLRLLKPNLKIVANDINPKRIRLMRDFHRACRVDAGLPAVSDLTRMAFKPGFDLILLDAPCSSSGTLRKNPDLKLKISPESLLEHSRLQTRMLDALLESHPGSRILYSVCSFTGIETERVIEQLVLHKGIMTDNRSLTPVLDEFRFCYKPGNHGIYLLPDRHLQNDLFYLCLIKGKKP